MAISWRLAVHPKRNEHPSAASTVRGRDLDRDPGAQLFLVSIGVAMGEELGRLDHFNAVGGQVLGRAVHDRPSP